MFQEEIDEYNRSKVENVTIAKSQKEQAIKAGIDLFSRNIELNKEQCSRITEKQSVITKEFTKIKSSMSSISARTRRLSEAVIAIERVALQFGDIENYLNVLESDIKKINAQLQGNMNRSRLSQQQLQTAEQHCARLFIERLPKARKRAKQLVRDIFVVIAGLRPSFMLDYISPPQSSSIQFLIEFMSAATSRVLSALEVKPDGYHVGRADDCSYFISRTGFEKLEIPMTVEFRISGDASCTTCQWSEEDAAMQHFKRVMLPPSSASVSSILQLDDCNACLPTLNGLLLGYPAVYLIEDIEQAQRVSRFLSTTTLQVYTIEMDGEHLLSFSVPENLIEDERWRVKYENWKSSLRSKFEESQRMGWPWKTLSVSSEKVLKGVAL